MLNQWFRWFVPCFLINKMKSHPMRRNHFYWIKLLASTRANAFEKAVLTFCSDYGQFASAHSFMERVECTPLG